MLYRALKGLLRIAVSIFYKEVHVQGRALLPGKGPLIVAVNHPNTLMDPLVVALQLKQRTGFLANAGIFANGLLKWIFSKLHLIPIYRQQDVKKGEAADNSASFRKCYEYLLKGGTIMIFPEGSSVNEMKLRKLKTGTARIALETAALSNFASGLQIAPVALNYTDPIRFHSRLYIRVDAPIAVDAYAEAYKADPVAAVQQLTEELTLRLEQNLIIAEQKEEETLLRRIRKLYKDQLEAEEGRPLKPQEEFILQQEIAKAIGRYQQLHPSDFHRLSGKLNDYFNKIEQANLKEGFFAVGYHPYKKLLFICMNLLLLLVLMPLYLIGLLTNYVPYILPSKIAAALGTDIEYRAGIMMLSGLVLFPLYYGLMIYLFYLFITASAITVVLFALSLPLLGFFTLYYWRIAQNTASLLRYLNLRMNKKELVEHLFVTRSDLVQELGKAEVVFRTAPLREKEST